MLKLEQDKHKTPFGNQHVQQASTVQCKGRPGALELVLDPDAALLEILRDLESMLQQNRHLIGQTSIRLRFGQRPIDTLQFQEIKQILDREGLELERIDVSQESIEEFLEDTFGLPVRFRTSAQAAAKPIAIKEPAAAPSVEQKTTPATMATQPDPVPMQTIPAQPATQAVAPPMPKPVAPPMPQIQKASAKTFPQTPTRPVSRRPYNEKLHGPSNPPPRGPLPELETKPESTRQQPQRPGLQMNTNPFTQTSPKLHKIAKTCRAGTFYDVEGDIVVFGDVNAGAELRATGDIIVFGALRGIAHAGSKGDRDATITAFTLQPTQLRLGDQIAIAPHSEERGRQSFKTEVAYVNNSGAIEVETCQGRMPDFLQLRLTTS